MCKYIHRCVVTIQGLAVLWYSCTVGGKYSWSYWDAWHAFVHRWVSHTWCKLHVYLHVSAWHISWPLLPSVAPSRESLPA